MKRHGVGAGVLLVLGLAGVARAEEARPHVQLRWQAPAECPDDLALQADIESFLGQPVARAREQQLTIDAHVLGDALHGYAAKVVFATPTGTSERSMEHADCAKVTEAAALLMALAIDPERVRAVQEASARGEQSEPESRPSAAAPPAAPLPPPLQALPPQARREQTADLQQEPPKAGSAVRFSVGLFGLAAQGILPSVGPGLGLELAARLGSFEAAVGARSWASRSAAVPGAPGVAVDLSLQTAGLRLCAVPARGKWSLLACARGDLGDMSGEGQQVNHAHSGHALFAGVGGGLGVAYALGRLSPRLGADVLWTAAQPRFGVLQEGVEIQAFSPRSWHLAGFVGLAYEL